MHYLHSLYGGSLPTKALAKRLGISETEMECHCGRAEKRGLYCNQYCKMTRCAMEKGIDFGPKTWYAEMVEQYSCPECSAINSAYDRKCRECGASPSCNYVRIHGEEVSRHGSRLAL